MNYGLLFLLGSSRSRPRRPPPPLPPARDRSAILRGKPDYLNSQECISRFASDLSFAEERAGDRLPVLYAEIVRGPRPHPRLNGLWQRRAPQKCAGLWAAGPNFGAGQQLRPSLAMCAHFNYDVASRLRRRFRLRASDMVKFGVIAAAFLMFGLPAV
jgi:hypothetical protein